MTTMQRTEPGTTPNLIHVVSDTKLSTVSFQGIVTDAPAGSPQVKIGFFPLGVASAQPDDANVNTISLRSGSFKGRAKANVDLDSGDEYQLFGWVGQGNTWSGPHWLGTNYVTAASEQPLRHSSLCDAVNELEISKESLVVLLQTTMRLAAPRILEPAGGKVRSPVEDFTPVPGGGALRKAVVVDSQAKRVIVTVQRPSTMIPQYPLGAYLVDAIKGANNEWTAERVPLAVIEPNTDDPPQNRLVAWAQYNAQVWGVCTQLFYGGRIT